MVFEAGMKQKFDKRRGVQSDLSWVFSALVVSLLLVGAFWAMQTSGRVDSFLLATAVVLLVSAGAGSLKNVIRARNLSGQMMADSMTVALQEQILSEHTIVCVTDTFGTITEVNKNFSETFGYTKDEIIGQPASALYRTDAAGSVYHAALITVKQGSLWSGLEELSDKFGRRITTQTTISPKVGRNGQVVGFVFIRTDVTSAIAQSAEDSRNELVEILRDGVIIYDPWSYEVSYTNDAFIRRSRWATDTKDPKSLNDLFHKHEMQLFQRYLGPLLNNEAHQVMFEFDHASGPVEVLTHAIEDMPGKRSLISVVRDISERKKAEQLKLSSVSTVSHELRTPLTSIKGALRLLDSGLMGEMTHDARKLVNVAHRNSERLLAIVNDILTLEKLHSGNLMISANDVDLRTILTDSAEANAPFAAECNVKFTVEDIGKPAHVRADPQRLMQVMSNLLSNAAKFSPAGSDVKMRIRDSGDVWRVCVEDQGPGIPEHARDTLFDSFIQIEGTQSNAFPSTGLGLTICREIVHRHGGQISFDTKVGEGTTFYFDLEKSVASEMSMNETAVA
ncbi:hypothetical protein MGEO_17290 [Marivita geojedonensis]|uniref:histidine kinase n=1 Tax=Marivita geojedonensis TaxID=1123756 RepID=A0A1X4NHG7_9RHOB|nr:hypothetical protein MGEO_17290 [Marivita geojedonensis]